jgi:hypothetical protein
VQFLHPPQRFERLPFCNGCSYGVKNYGVEVTSNGKTSILNVIKKLPIGLEVDREAARQDGDLISLLLFPFRKESRVIIQIIE